MSENSGVELHKFHCILAYYFLEKTVLLLKTMLISDNHTFHYVIMHVSTKV
jgi:hypothetical protein